MAKPPHNLYSPSTLTWADRGLDEIWAAAPFPTKARLVRQVAATVDAWVQAGQLGRAEGEAVVRTARDASYTP